MHSAGIVFLLCICALPAQALERFDFSAPLMATTFRISLHAESKEQAEAAADAAFKRIAALNAVCSDYEPNSELMRLVNTGPHLPFRASDDLFTIITRALELSRLTDGAFDITCGNLSHLWRRTRRLKKLPPADRLQQALAATDWRAVQLDANAHTITLLKPGMLLDLGGIAKGYAADAALRVLRSAGYMRRIGKRPRDLRFGQGTNGHDGQQFDHHPHLLRLVVHLFPIPSVAENPVGAQA